MGRRAISPAPEREEGKVLNKNTPQRKYLYEILWGWKVKGKEVVFSSGSRVFRVLATLAAMKSGLSLNNFEQEACRNEKVFPMQPASARQL